MNSSLNKSGASVYYSDVGRTINADVGSEGASFEITLSINRRMCFWARLSDSTFLVRESAVGIVILYYIILYYTILYYTILYYTILYYTILYTLYYNTIYYNIIQYDITL